MQCRERDIPPGELHVFRFAVPPAMAESLDKGHAGIRVALATQPNGC